MKTENSAHYKPPTNCLTWTTCGSIASSSCPGGRRPTSSSSAAAAGQDADADTKSSLESSAKVMDMVPPHEAHVEYYAPPLGQHCTWRHAPRPQLAVLFTYRLEPLKEGNRHHQCKIRLEGLGQRSCTKHVLLVDGHRRHGSSALCCSFSQGTITCTDKYSYHDPSSLTAWIFNILPKFYLILT